MVSGDVFDHAVPSAEALELLEDTLSRLLGIAATVVTAGNHDSCAVWATDRGCSTIGSSCARAWRRSDSPVFQ